MSSKNPRLIARIHELHRQGLSLRRIESTLAADGTPYARQSIANALKRSNPGPLPPDPAPVVEELGDVDADAPLEIVRARLAEVRSIISTLKGQVLSGDYDPSKWGALVKIEAELAKRVVALTPAAAPDPSADPWNVGARTLILDTVRHNVTAVLRRHGAK